MSTKWRKEIMFDGAYTFYYLGDHRKVVEYPKDNLGPSKIYAYFRPIGWNNFGNSCERENNQSKVYKTVKEAKAACEAHFKKFGERPHHTARL